MTVTTPDASGTTGMEFTENRVVQDLSARHEYNMLQDALHLPNFNELADADEAAIAARITNTVTNFRHRFAAIEIFTGSQAEQQFLQAYNEMLGSKRPNMFTRGVNALMGDAQSRERENIARAKAFLKVLHQNLTPEDVRRHIQELSHINTEVAGLPNTTWQSNGPVAIAGVPPGIVQIDLSQPMWQGTEANIRSRLANQTIDQAGIEVSVALPIDYQLTGADINNIFTSQCQVRDQNAPARQPPVTIALSLTNAIAATAAVSQLATGTADSRELLLALAAIRRDPTAAQVLGGGNRTPELTAAKTRLEQERVLSAAIAKLEGLRAPTMNRHDIEDEIHDIDARPNPAGDGDNTGFYSEKKEDKAHARHQLENLENLTDVVNQITSFMAANPTLNPILLAPAAPVPNFSYLRTFLNFPAPPAAPTAEENLIANNRLNPTRLVQEIRSTFNHLPASANKSASLGTVEQYAKLLEENHKQLESAQQQSVDNGSNACWAVIRRSLEHQGLRGDDLEQTIGHMRGELQRTPETPDQIKNMTETIFPPRLDNEEAEEKWTNSEKRSFRQLSKLGLKNDPWTEYRDNLFNTKGIGMKLADNPLDSSIDLKVVIDAYFATKYLQNLPDDDVKSLPKSPEIMSFLRKLHAGILERAQAAFSANSVPSRDLEALRAEGLGIDASKLANLSMTERLTAVQSYLGGASRDSIAGNPHYTTDKKDEIEKTATRAFQPIQEQIDNHNWWKESMNNRAGNVFKGNGSVYNPLIWPAQFLRKFVGGEGTAKNPLTWPSKAVQFVASLPSKAVSGGKRTWSWLWATTNPAAAGGGGGGGHGHS